MLKAHSVHRQLVLEGWEIRATRNLVSKSPQISSFQESNLHHICATKWQILIVIQEYEEQYFTCFDMNSSGMDLALLFC